MLNEYDIDPVELCNQNEYVHYEWGEDGWEVEIREQ